MGFSGPTLGNLLLMTVGGLLEDYLALEPHSTLIRRLAN